MLSLGMTSSNVLLLLFTLLLRISEGCDENTQWAHDSYLDNQNRVYIKWNIDQQYLVMQMTGQTTGWLGVGFSPSGSMRGADIVMAWFKNDKPFLQDRHGLPDRNGRPPVDKNQDYELVSGNKNDTHMTFCFRRKLNTCDKDDFIIDNSTIRVIWAMNPFVPANDTEQGPRYHGPLNRGVLSLYLAGSVFEKPKIEGLKYIDMKLPNVEIPHEDTYYWCQFFRMPDLKEKHHIVGYEPIVQEGNEALVHHILVYECNGDDIAERLENVTNNGYKCYIPNAPVPFTQCRKVMIAWAVGSKGEYYPSHTGFPFGNIENRVIYYMFEVHYDNPTLRQYVRDSSGLRLFYTDQLRQYDASILTVGYEVGPFHIIPPKQDEYTSVSHCATECLQEKLPEGGIRTFGVLLHTHLTGVKIRVRHFRDGKELSHIASNENYDFNFQQGQFFEEEIPILPKDSLAVECVYKTEVRNVTTLGGESSRDEMCLAFLMYYPRTSLSWCVSSLFPPQVYKLTGVKEVYERNNELEELVIKEPQKFRNITLVDHLKHYKWGKKDIKTVRSWELGGDKRPVCKNDIGKFYPPGLKTVNYPKASPYVEDDVCSKKNKNRKKKP